MPFFAAPPRARFTAPSCLLLLVTLLCTVFAIFPAGVSAQDKFHSFSDRSVLLSKTRDAWFDTLTPQELASDWSHDDTSMTFYTRAKNATKFSTVVFVEVRLIGFQQDGYRSFPLSDTDVQRFLDASGINLNAYTYVISPSSSYSGAGAGGGAGSADNDDVNGRDDNYVDIALEGDLSSEGGASDASASNTNGGDGDDLLASATVGGGHQLPVRQKVLFRVRHAPPALHARVAAAVQAAVTQQAATHTAQRAAAPARSQATMPTADKIWYHIPHEDVESVLAEDFKANSVSYTIYMMSPTAPTVTAPAAPGTASGPVPARYVYSQHARLEQQRTADPTLRRRPQCEAVVWASTHRFAFLDLTAGPVTYGPQASGDGIFAESSLPRLDRLFRRHDLEASVFTDQALGEAAEVDAKVARGVLSGTGPDAKADPGVTGMGDALRGFRAASKTRAVAEARALAQRNSMRNNGGVALEPMELVKRDYAAKKHEFMAELAQSVRATAQALILPPVWRFPVPFYRTVLVNLIVIYDHELAVVEEMTRWKALTASLQQHALPGQIVKVDVSHVQFEQCELCVAAYTHSLKTYTSNVMTSADAASSGASGMRTKIHEYLDSDAMHDWLEHFERGFWNLRSGVVKETMRLTAKSNSAASAATTNAIKATTKGANGRKKAASAREQEDGHDSSAADSTVTVEAETVKASKATFISPQEAASSIRVVNAFVFDLATQEPLLFDRLHQAVGFQDVVVGVQTHAEMTTVDAVCNGQTMKTDPSDASRALLGSLLSTLFGVAPSGVGYNPSSNSTELAHMWTVGMTPYGHFAQGLDSHFGLKDAAHRNVLLSEAYAVISNLKTLLSTMLRLRKDARELLDATEFKKFNQRFNLLQFKMQKAENHASLNSYSDGLYYAISARHDVAAMEAIFRSAVRRVRPVLVCANEEADADAQGESIVERIIGATLAAVGGAGDADAVPAGPGHKNITWHKAGGAGKDAGDVKRVAAAGVSVEDDDDDDEEESTVASRGSTDVDSTGRYTAAFRQYENKTRLRGVVHYVELVFFVLFVVFCVYLVFLRARGGSSGSKQIDDAADYMLAAGNDAVEGLGLGDGAGSRNGGGVCAKICCRSSKGARGKYRD